MQKEDTSLINYWKQAHDEIPEIKTSSLSTGDVITKYIWWSNTVNIHKERQDECNLICLHQEILNFVCMNMIKI